MAAILKILKYLRSVYFDIGYGKISQINPECIFDVDDIIGDDVTPWRQS